MIIGAVSMIHTVKNNGWQNARIAIVGCGAVGTYYGAKLAQAGADVHFLLRSDYEQVKKHGLKIHCHQGDFELPQVQAYQSSADIGPCDLIIVAIKATANDVLPKVLLPLIKENTAILTLQNGMGNAEFLAAHFGAERIMGGACFVCINRLAPGVVQNFQHGLIALGELQGAPTQRTKDLVELWKASGVPSQLEESLKALLWRKLTWNVPFNGLTIAAGGIDVSGILADENLAKIARKLMGELIQAAAADGVKIEPSYIDFQMDRTAVMGPYKPSSLIDFLAGRAVEVEAIWGEPLRRALAKKVPAPRLEMLYALLRNLCVVS
jgi:2-dehydropantoate 2-reductase